MIELSPQFLVWLEKTPQVLAKIADIANEWYKIQGELTSIGDPEGPQEFTPHEKQSLRTKGISPSDLDAIHQGYAEAIVKEKAMEYIKGFVAGVMLVT